MGAGGALRTGAGAWRAGADLLGVVFLEGFVGLLLVFLGRDWVLEGLRLERRVLWPELLDLLVELLDLLVELLDLLVELLDLLVELLDLLFDHDPHIPACLSTIHANPRRYDAKVFSFTPPFTKIFYAESLWHQINHFSPRALMFKGAYEWKLMYFELLNNIPAYPEYQKIRWTLQLEASYWWIPVYLVYLPLLTSTTNTIWANRLI